ncbi:MAG: toll/interleukin-1 receptor domain-containing protein [Chitinophagaceae bacterium]|nr:toll/interleukin-1 receptor domain-containing protein [Chitinophagaceae bacterium]MCW5904149.1 toll/interleukin-1 receptor domain-containing protein [Chitinophagaceae bacterium]
MLDGTVSLSRLIELYVFYSINTVKVMNYCGEQLSILHHTQYHSESILFNSEKNQEVAYDVFVSHASEDKEDFVRDFVKCLQQHGLKVWYDEFTLRVGDSLRRSIDNGLKNSRYGIVVLSEAFFSKEWPQRELDGLFAREVNGEKVILPIWHKISKNEVLKFSPIIADMLALNTSSFTIEEIAKEISDRVLN